MNGINLIQSLINMKINNPDMISLVIFNYLDVNHIY